VLPVVLCVLYCVVVSCVCWLGVACFYLDYVLDLCLVWWGGVAGVCIGSAWGVLVGVLLRVSFRCRLVGGVGMFWQGWCERPYRVLRVVLYVTYVF